MFTEMKQAIDAAEYVISSFSFDKNSAKQNLENYNAIESPDDYDKYQRGYYATRLDLYNELEKFIIKWVKSQM